MTFDTVYSDVVPGLSDIIGLLLEFRVWVCSEIHFYYLIK